MGFSLNRHYCLGMLVDEVWYYVSDECQPNHNDRETSCTESIDEFGSCCSDKWLSIEGLSVNSKTAEQQALQNVKFKDIKPVLANASFLKPRTNAKVLARGIDKERRLPSQNIIIKYHRFLI